MAARSRVWYHANPDRAQESSRKWKAAHKEQQREYAQAYHARKAEERRVWREEHAAELKAEAEARATQKAEERRLRRSDGWRRRYRESAARRDKHRARTRAYGAAHPSVRIGDGQMVILSDSLAPEYRSVIEAMRALRLQIRKTREATRP